MTAGAISGFGFQPVTFVDIENLVTSDRFEVNDVFDPANGIDQSTRLGSEPTVILRDLSITDNGIDPADVDNYSITAHQTGKLIVNALFNHELGDLNMRILDSAGNEIAAAISADDNEQLIIPVVGQETYIIEVTSAQPINLDDCFVNNYALEVENFAAPVPYLPDLIVVSDSGMMNDDEVTNINTPTIHVIADLGDFAAMGIPVDQGAGVAGADVVVGFTDLAGTTINVNATNIGGTGPSANTLWEAVVPTALADGQYQVSAWVRIEDGAATPAVGRAAVSEPLQVVIDILAPVDPTADLLAVSDSGTSNTDNITNKMQPAFSGLTEAGSKVRLFASGELVGSAVAGTDGLWGEPLVDGQHDVTVVARIWRATSVAGTTRWVVGAG